MSGRFSALMAAAISIVLVTAGCAAPQPPPPGRIRTWESIADQGYSDVFLLSLPEGWKMIPLESVHRALEYEYLLGDGDGPVEVGLRVRYLRPRIGVDDLLLYADDPTDDGITKMRDISIKDAAKIKEIVDVKPLPDLDVGGATAKGYSYAVPTEQDFVQTWSVWRHDGLWYFSFHGSDDVPAMPQAMVDALGKATWICEPLVFKGKNCCVESKDDTPRHSNCSE